MADTVDRFADRVADYDRWRPDYPHAAIELLVERAGLSPGTTIADVGSGTGILSEQLLDCGARVIGVEPGEAMRAQADVRLDMHPNFSQVDGTSDATGLDDASCDLVVAAQAFHWFDQAATRREWLRILKPDGIAAIVWNNRLTGETAFLREYEALLLALPGDYAEVRHGNVTDDDLDRFFGGGGPELHTFEHAQQFPWEGLAGRAFSSSYVPARDSDAGRDFERQLHELFDAHAVDGHVTWLYQTNVFLGPMA
jgi:SAM-dependent methyltransferase